MDFFAAQPQFNTLSLLDLLKARDQFHPHLLHKANVVGTALGRYLIRKDDPYPTRKEMPSPQTKKNKPPRTLENSEVRDYSWPAILVFVSRWVDEKDFGGDGEYPAYDMLPKTIYLEDGKSVPVCVVKASLVETASPPIDPTNLKFPEKQIAGGYPVNSRVQGVDHIASIGCLLTDGNKIYALTSRHVTGEPGAKLVSRLSGKEVALGLSSEKQIGRLPFEQVYDTWPGKNIFINVDVGLIEIQDQGAWNPSVFGLGQLGPLADLSVYNMTLNLIGCPVRAYGAASGRLSGQIAALFYRYKSVGGFEYVADFLIGSRTKELLSTRPGDSGTIWVVDSEEVEHDLMPIGIQWGGTVLSSETTQFPFALATNLSTVCRELGVELYRARGLAPFEYWGAVGHFSIASYACQLVGNAQLKTLMLANRRRVSFDSGAITMAVNDVTVPDFVPLANVPDKVWKKHPNFAAYGRKGPENPNHYANLDFARNGIQSLDALTPTAAALDPQTWREYYHAVGWNAVSQRGLLPFRVWQIYKKMVEYVTQNKVTEYVAAAGVLAHYVGDACQTLHGSYLTDGDPFRDPDGSPSDPMLGLGEGFGGGVHTAYEKDMLDEHVEELLEGIDGALGTSHGMNLLQGGQNAGFATIELMRRTRARIQPIDLVEAYGALVLADERPTAPEVLWNKFKEQTIASMVDGCRTLAMLWESAWTEGIGNHAPPTQLGTKSKSRLKEIYEDCDFLPSKPLGQIDQHL